MFNSKNFKSVHNQNSVYCPEILSRFCLIDALLLLFFVNFVHADSLYREKHLVVPVSVMVTVLYFKARLFTDEPPVNQIITAKGIGRQVPGENNNQGQKRERTNSDTEVASSGLGRVARFSGGLCGGGASDDEDDDDGEKNTGENLEPQSQCQATAILINDSEKSSESEVIEGASGKSKDNVVIVHRPCPQKVEAANQVDVAVEVNPADNNPDLHQIAANLWYSYEGDGAFCVGESRRQFVAVIPEDLVCQVCMHPLINAVMFCQQSHHICRRCCRTGLQNCPLCQGCALSSPITNHEYDRKILCCQCICPHCNRDCDLGNISEHMQDCPELPQNCAFCHTDIPGSEFPAHLQQCSVSHQGDIATTEQLQQVVRQLINIIQQAVFPVQGSEAGNSLYLSQAHTLLDPVSDFPGVYMPHGAPTSDSLFIMFNWYLLGASKFERYLGYTHSGRRMLRIHEYTVWSYRLTLNLGKDEVDASIVLTDGPTYSFWITFEILDANGCPLFVKKMKTRQDAYGTARPEFTVPLSVFKSPGKFFMKLTISSTPPTG